MEISINNLNNYTPDMIYHNFKTLFNDIYDEYVFGCFTYKKYEEIVIKEIQISQREYKGREKYEIYIKNKVTNRIKNHLSKILNDETFSQKLISTFIDSKCNNFTNYRSAINNIDKISNYVSRCNYVPTPDLILYLLNNNTNFLAMINTIFTRHKKAILAGYTDELFDSYIIIQALDAYCNIKNIEIKERPSEISNTIRDKSSLDTIDAYLMEISNFPVLSREEEQTLASRIKNGDNEARKKFTECNLKLVVNIAKKYASSSEQLLELIGEGNIGLLTAIDKFDPSKGIKFSTYGVWWIRQAICMSFYKNGRTIRLPSNKYYNVLKFKKIYDDSENIQNIDNRIACVAKKMGISEQKAIELYKLQFDVMSINSKVDDENDDELGETIASNDPIPEEIYENKMLRIYLEKIIDTTNIKERDKDALKYRYGFIDGEFHTLGETGKRYNLTRERIRQIELSALKKLRRNKLTKGMAEYTDNPDVAIKNLERLNNLGAKRKRITKNELSFQEPKKDIEALKKERLLLSIISEKELDRCNYINVVNLIKEKELMKALDYKQLLTTVKILSATQGLILLLRYGYINGKQYNLIEICKILNVTEDIVLNTFRDVIGPLDNYFKSANTNHKK